MSNDFPNRKDDFPIFKTFRELVYLDSASTSQKPHSVIAAVADFYKKKNANTHRGIYKLAEEATEAYENVRDLVAQFINANKREEIIFTGNVNQSINLVAHGWGRKFLKQGDIIVLSEMEHHANIVPWLRLKEEIGVELIFLPIIEDGRLDDKILMPERSRRQNSSTLRQPADRSEKKIDVNKIKLVALTHISNVLGTINPIEEVTAFLKKQNPGIKILIDAAQSVAHIPLDVKKLKCDFLVFSGHKMLGPTGVGVLWAKEFLLEKMDPLFVGSHMIKSVTKEKAIFTDLPEKFEVGTGNLEGVVGLGAAIKYLQSIGMEKIMAHDHELTQYALNKLQALPYLTMHGPQTADNRIGIFSFEIPKVHPHDIAQILDNRYIAIRSGHHCCQVLMQTLGVTATARASFYLYNTKEDIDRLVDGIESVKKILKI